VFLVCPKTQRCQFDALGAWVATGNNPALSTEIARRVVRIRMDAKTERPQERQGFRHPKLRVWVTEHRAELIHACLTLVRAWIADGKPQADNVPAFGSYEDWASVIGGILSTAAISGFLGNAKKVYDQADEEGAAIRSFLSA
jgi:putative DNA primase/helicase